jgi:hypothetical protein
MVGRAARGKGTGHADDDYFFACPFFVGVVGLGNTADGWVFVEDRSPAVVGLVSYC